MDDHPSSSSVKLLLLGNTGAGKTGLLATLAKNYRLFIADFDSGLDILRDPNVLTPTLRKNVFYKTFYDKMNIIGGKAIPNAQAYTNFWQALSSWKETTEGPSSPADVKIQDLGNLYSWTEKDVFILDSLTFFGNATLAHVMQTAGKSAGGKPEIQHYGAAIDAMEALLETFYNPAVKCNVIITAHLIPLGDDFSGGVQKLFPSALGKKLPPKVGRYFNSVVMIQKSGSGNATKRELHTVATFNTDLKVSKPSKVPPVMEPDLDKLFTLLKGE